MGLAGDKLFTNVMYNVLVPSTQNITSGLDSTTLCSPQKIRSVTECDFITRMLFKDVY